MRKEIITNYLTPIDERETVVKLIINKEVKNEN